MKVGSDKYFAWVETIIITMLALFVSFSIVGFTVWVLIGIYS